VSLGPSFVRAVPSQGLSRSSLSMSAWVRLVRPERRVRRSTSRAASTYSPAASFKYPLARSSLTDSYKIQPRALVTACLLSASYFAAAASNKLFAFSRCCDNEATISISGVGPGWILPRSGLRRLTLASTSANWLVVWSMAEAASEIRSREDSNLFATPSSLVNSDGNSSKKALNDTTCRSISRPPSSDMAKMGSATRITAKGQARAWTAALVTPSGVALSNHQNAKEQSPTHAPNNTKPSAAVTKFTEVLDNVPSQTVYDLGTVRDPTSPSQRLKWNGLGVRRQHWSDTVQRLFRNSLTRIAHYTVRRSFPWLCQGGTGRFKATRQFKLATIAKFIVWAICSGYGFDKFERAANVVRGDKATSSAGARPDNQTESSSLRGTEGRSQFSPLFFPGMEADEISILLSIDPAPFRCWAFCLGSGEWRFDALA
jgi:hypothetical protein